MSEQHGVPDYDSIPDTRDLVPPTSDEIPIATLANTIAIRALRRDIRDMRDAGEALRKSVVTWGLRIVVAIVTGGATMAGSVVGVAMKYGEGAERQRHLASESVRHDERITKLEERQWQR